MQNFVSILQTVLPVNTAPFNRPCSRFFFSSITTRGIIFLRNCIKCFVSDNDATSVQVDLVKGLGADQVINYKEQNWGEVLKGENYDAIFDCVGVLRNHL
jgi:hypothetical protein